MKLLHQNIKIPACSKDTIARADDVFSYIDSDFDELNLDKRSPKTKETELAVMEIDKNGTFKDIFGSISKDTDSMCLTQAQIIAFVKEHKDKLRTDCYGTFFLFKVNGEVFVARVLFDVGGQLRVRVFGLSYGYVWYAEFGHRFVVPQLALKNYDLSPSETLTLEARIEKLEEIVERIRFWKEGGNIIK